MKTDKVKKVNINKMSDKEIGNLISNLVCKMDNCDEMLAIGVSIIATAIHLNWIKDKVSKSTARSYSRNVSDTIAEKLYDLLQEGIERDEKWVDDEAKTISRLEVY